ncbi:hypothetical protein GH714_026074 [Hevea brasiliensis]|uniref:Pentacotripeptide-repeat region of PRORP domain-containing protein n=1 Tax=Hevea brasiliensis TaxID=3981 RepID=A0A6A6K6T7_HEVBR|nr:hypothetical protein GH714_026074 [Hevea brasiliensis]
MTALSSSANPYPNTLHRHRLTSPKPVHGISVPVSVSIPETEPLSIPSPSNNDAALAVTQRGQRRRAIDWEKVKKREAKEKKEEVNRKIASRKAISVILRRDATKATIEKKRDYNLNEVKILLYIQVFELLQEQLWYRPNSGMYIKLIVLLGKCKQPEKAYELFQAMIREGCVVNHESYTALLSAYGRSGLFDKAFTLLEEMKNNPDCQPDSHLFNPHKVMPPSFCFRQSTDATF